MRGTLVTLIIVFELFSCTAAPQPYSSISDVVESPMDHSVHIQGQPGDVRQKDLDFVYRATVQCLYDIELARQAETRASSSAVKDFARRITDECRTQDHQLALLNEAHIGITLPRRLDQKHATQLDQIGALTGPTFDRAYVQDQLTECQETLELFQDQSTLGSEPVLQHFARAALPDLQQRQSDTKQLSDQFLN